MAQVAHASQPASQAPKPPGAAGALTVLVVDDSNLCRELVVEALRSHGYSTLSAADGKLGIDQLQSHRVDAVILDNEMPNMNGMTFLKTVRADQRWSELPIVMLTTNTSKELIVEAMNHKVNGYLVKAKFSMTEMFSRVRSALARVHGAGAVPPQAAAHPKSAGAAPARAARPQPAPPPPPPPPPTVKVPNLVGRDAVLAAAADFKIAKTLAGDCAQIAEIAAAGKTGIADFAAVIRQDPVLAARVVQQAIVGSPSGQKARIAGIEDAIRAVGADGVRDLAASLAVLKAFPDASSDGVGLLHCWEHALAVATIMARVIPKNDAVPSSLPHLIGLLHDLAEIFLRQRYTQEFNAVLDFAKQTRAPVSTVIASVFGATCADITEALFEHLKIPDSVSEPIAEFQFNAGKPVEAHKTLVSRSLAISDFMAAAMLFAPTRDALIAPVWQNDCRAFLIPPSPINFAEIRSESTTSIIMNAKIPSGDETAAMKPLFNRRQTIIWYVRHSSFAPIDPIEAALNSLAAPKTHDRLPHPAELAGIQAVIILSPGHGSPSMTDIRRSLGQAQSQIPVLILDGSATPHGDTSAPEGIQQMHCPVTLHQLADFIGKLATR